MSRDNHNENRLARPPGNQGARFSAGNQADNEKLATGMNSMKRKYSASTVDADCPSTTNSWPRFLIIKDPEMGDLGLSSISSILISRELENLVGKLKMIRRINGTDLLVECSTSLQSETLLRTTEMFDGGALGHPGADRLGRHRLSGDRGDVHAARRLAVRLSRPAAHDAGRRPRLRRPAARHRPPSSARLTITTSSVTIVGLTLSTFFPYQLSVSI